MHVSKYNNDDSFLYGDNDLDDYDYSSLGLDNNDLSFLDERQRIINEERIKEVKEMLREMFIETVLPKCARNLNLETGSGIEVSDDCLNNIVDEIVELGDHEVCGVNAGDLIVKYGINEPEQIGKFRISQNNISTFELHLSLAPANKIKQKIINLVRKLKGKPSVLMIAQKFTLTKKQLFNF